MNMALLVYESIPAIIDLGHRYHLQSTSGNLLNSTCLPPCRLLRYSVYVRPPEHISYELGYVRIYFAEDIIGVLIEKQAYDFIQAVGGFGGCLGMFLGVFLYVSLDRLTRLLVARRVEPDRWSVWINSTLKSHGCTSFKFGTFVSHARLCYEFQVPLFLYRKSNDSIDLIQ